MTDIENNPGTLPMRPVHFEIHWGDKRVAWADGEAATALDACRVAQTALETIMARLQSGENKGGGAIDFMKWGVS